jgi:hypothetical protein
MLQDIALKAFVTGLCKTAGTVIILAVGWKVFVATGNDRIRRKHVAIVESEISDNSETSETSEDSEIEIILNNLNSDCKFKKLFDKV